MNLQIYNKKRTLFQAEECSFFIAYSVHTEVKMMLHFEKN